MIDFIKYMCEDWFGKILFFMIILMVLGILSLPFLIYNQIGEDQARLDACHSLNGVLLTNTTGSGKTKSYSYVCVDPKLILN